MEESSSSNIILRLYFSGYYPQIEILLERSFSLVHDCIAKVKQWMEIVIQLKLTF